MIQPNMTTTFCFFFFSNQCKYFFKKSFINFEALKLGDRFYKNIIYHLRYENMMSLIPADNYHSEAVIKLYIIIFIFIF